MAKVESKKKGEDVSDEEIKRLFDSATQIVNNVVSGKHDPEIVRNDEMYVNPISLEGENHEKTYCDLCRWHMEQAGTEFKGGFSHQCP